MVLSNAELKKTARSWRGQGKKIVFTNGCFDLLHRGHVEYLNIAKSHGDILIVGINSDRSVRALKGAGRPLVNEDDRAFIVSQLRSVDATVIFDEDTPYRLIGELLPDILVKGGDYKPEEVVGKDIVENNGGKLVLVPLTPGRSTTGILEKITAKETMHAKI
jgi:D-beta-D-heptose 7-phosphate kinase/D-beta-D-heptose 1-phosphate adenosyltransferase